jgi:FMN reductase
MPEITVLIGNPKAHSRTRVIAEALATRMSGVTGVPLGTTIDLADYASELFEWPNAAVDAVSERVRQSTIVLVATPTYKASYTGLLKAFLDRYPHNGLSGVTAVPLMTTSSPNHALAVEFTLRPLLVELGASVPTRGLAFYMPDMGRTDDVLTSWLDDNILKLTSGILPTAQRPTVQLPLAQKAAAK